MRRTGARLPLALWALWLLACAAGASFAHAQPATTTRPASAPVQAPGSATKTAAQGPASPGRKRPSPAKPRAAATPRSAADRFLCPPGNLARTAQLTASKTTGDAVSAHDGVLQEEGERWESSYGLYFAGKDGGELVFDLRRPRSLQYLLVQADARDDYELSISTDGRTYERVWLAPTLPKDSGMRSRYVRLPQARTARYLRVRGVAGDGHYFVSEVRAHCQEPTPWPPELRIPAPKTGWNRLDSPVVISIKAALGIAAGCVLLLGFLLPYRKRPLPRRWWTVLIESALLLAGFAAITWTFLSTNLIGIRVGGGLLGAWFLVRWLAGAQTQPRRFFGPLGRAITGAPGRYVYWLLALAAIAAAYVKLDWLRAAEAAFALGVLYLWLRWARQPVSFANTVRLCLGTLGLIGLCGWWNFGHFHYNHYVHIWEHYHYFIGSKYGPELRYARIYECTAVADMLDGLGRRVKERKMRRIDTDNDLGTSDAIMADPGRCRRHFLNSRFQEFRKDVRFFRGRFSRERWDRSQTDHGYNATPVWGVAARLIAEQTGELSWEKIERLAAIDSLLLLAMWLAVLWAFGWQATAVALVYWGFNFPARFYWNGGAFLRFDWLFFLVLGLCFLRKGKPFWSGAALTMATGLRIFPGFVVAAIVLKALITMLRERRLFLSRQHAAFAAGCITMIALLLPASHWSMNGLDAWSEFAVNSKKHLKTALTNNMGLKTVLGYDFSTRASQMRNPDELDPFQGWKDARHYFYDKRMPLFYGLVLLYLAMLAIALAREDDWVAACLGVGLIPIAVELTCYYYGFLLAYGLMWQRRKLPGILAALLAGTTCILDQLPWNDDKYVSMSLANVLVVIAVTAHAAFGKRKLVAPDREDDAPESQREAPVLALPAASADDLRERGTA